MANKQASADHLLTIAPTWAVHSLHSPAVEVDRAGTMTLDGKTRIPLPAPLFTADTRQEAERLRLAARG